MSTQSPAPASEAAPRRPMRTGTRADAPWLAELQRFLAPDIAMVRECMQRVYNPEGALMGEVARYVSELPGKLLRPSVLCLVARAHGHDPTDDRHARLGAAMEIFHVASLLHDDVIDKSTMRRGRLTVNARWGDDVAILFADYLYASCFDLAMSVLDPEVMRILTRTTQRMTEGEMYQIEKRGSVLTTADYVKIVESKTAYLFAACAGLGALLGNAPTARVLRMSDFGLAYGTAFQITDDTLDFEASDAHWGKPIGTDVACGKQTLPVLQALESASPGDREALIAILGDGRDFERIREYVHRYDGIHASLDRATSCINDALAILDQVETPSDALEHLRAMTRAVLVREY